MKSVIQFSPMLAVVFSFALLAGCSKGDSDDKPAAARETAAPTKAGVTLDAETQERLGLKLASPAPAQWQPQLTAVGNVADPLVFAVAVADLEAARAAAAASETDFERTKTLAEQNNASPKSLETAQAAAKRDALAVKAAEARFAGDWGDHYAAETNLSGAVTALQRGDFSLIKLSLPVGVFPNPLPRRATIFLFGSETNAVEAELADDLHVTAGTQTQALLFSARKPLPAGVAVTAQLQTAGETVNGVTVPLAAVLRHQGAGWVYVQTGTNEFDRVEIPLDRLTADGWFVSEKLSATNRLVVSGAQTVLSAELSGGAFTTGERD